MKFAIVGTSWITEAYIDGALDSSLWSLAAIYSRTTEKGLAFGEKYGVTTVFTDLSEMARSPLFEAVYIASPNAFHFDQCKLFLEHGKHVICEKPITTHLQHTQELHHIAAENHLILLEAIMHLHLPQRFLLEKAIAKIGPLTMGTFDFCQRSSKYDAYLEGVIPNIFNPTMEAGALMDLGIYCLYPAFALFGEPESYTVDLTLMETGVDSGGIVTLRYPSGMQLCLRYSKISQAGANSDIQGRFGSISIESISRLANISLSYSDGRKEIVCGEEPKYKLMGYEAKDFYRYITDPSSRTEYEHCTRLSLLVTDYLERFRNEAGVHFPSDQ